MVNAYFGNNRRTYFFKGIGCVKSAAKPRFGYNYIAFFIGKVRKCRGGYKFKLR